MQRESYVVQNLQLDGWMDEWTSGFKAAIYSQFWTWDYTKGHNPSVSDYFESPQYLKPRINVHTYIAGSELKLTLWTTLLMSGEDWRT